MRRVDLGELPPDLLPLYQETAAACRGDFDALIGSLYPDDGDPARLLAGPLSRSPFVSSLFLDCVRLRFVETLVSRGGIDELVVGTAPLKRVLDAGLRGEAVRVVLAESAARRARRLLRPLVRAAKAAARLAAAVGRGRRLPPGLPPLTLLDTFLVDGAFRDGIFRDRYYPGLLDALNPAERDAVYFLPEFPEGEDAGALIHAAEDSGERFLFKDAYLTIGDRIAVLLSPLRTLAAPPGPRPFGRFDAAPLIRADAWETAWNFQSLAGLLNLAFARRLKEAGVAVRLVVDWSENQLLDRGLALGFHRAYPSTPVVGYCGYVIAPVAHPYTRPTRPERAAGLVPDRLVVTGPALVSGARAADPGLAVEDGPAFRFQGVRRARRARPDPGATTVLLALPISREGALDALRLAADARLEGVRFTVKPHPTMPPSHLRAAFEAEGRAWPASFAFVSGDFADRVEEADALAGSVSSTCVEAAATGVPVIIVGNARGLTEDPIPEGLAAGMRRVAFTPEEFARAVRELATKDPAAVARYAQTGQAVADACFRPVDEDGVRRLLQLERTKT